MVQTSAMVGHLDSIPVHCIIMSRHQIGEASTAGLGVQFLMPLANMQLSLHVALMLAVLMLGWEMAL